MDRTSGPAPAPTGTQAIDRAAELLRLVVESERPRTFTSLMAETGLAKSTVSRLLQALERHHLLRRDQEGAFRAGPVFTRYALRGDITDTLVDLAGPTLERLGERTGETVTLAVPRFGEVITVAQVDSSYLLSATSWIGLDLPTHCTASGKVFYAHGRLPLPVDGDLPARTERSITSPDVLAREFPEIHRRGYAVARDELEIGLVAIGAPVFASDAAVIATIAVTGPTARLDRRRTGEAGALLVEETGTLSALLGHRPPP
ncbi:IclR family transcriptional regulator [Spirillospora sp. NPDC047279]|uniref:IclR family transcriptional regulator n=1 Tax=Spirillospora sp. NPDC047279 TaxID=3155478 RepID=UPI0033CE6340